MKVSVVIPVYNVKPYLKRCVQSVFVQDYPDIEIILVDDGSTDGSSELCDEIATWAPYIHTIHQPNQGLSAARNTGIRHAIGEYIAFLDSDDKWLLDYGLTTLLPKGKITSDLILFKHVNIWRYDYRTKVKDNDVDSINNRYDAQALFEFLVMAQQFLMSACFLLVRRQLLIDHNIYFPVGYISEDIHWSLLLWQNARTVTITNLELYGYYHRSGSLSSTPSRKAYDSYDKMFTYWKAECDKGCVNAKAIRVYLANLWVSRGYDYNKLKSIDKPHALSIMKRHADLLDHASTPKARRTAKLVQIIGIKSTIILLGWYWSLRTLLKRTAI